MNTITAFIPTDIISLHHGQPMTTSLKVAEAFGKLHKNVLRKLETLDCSPEFTKLNFELCFNNSELQNGKPQPFFKMTKDGFMFLVMGFTGKQAAAIKEAYIKAFNAMADCLRDSGDKTSTLNRIYKYAGMLRDEDRSNILLEQQLEERFYRLQDEMSQLREDIRAMHRSHRISRDLSDHIRFAISLSGCKELKS